MTTQFRAFCLGSLLLPSCLLFSQTAQLTQVVIKAKPSVALDGAARLVNVGNPMQWVSTVQGIPLAPATGSVQFMESAGTQVISTSLPQPVSTSGAKTQAGSALWTMPANKTGLFDINAFYSGDNNYSALSSAPVEIAVLPAADFSLHVPKTLTVHQGQSIDVPVEVDSLNDWHGTVNLSCNSAQAFNCNIQMKALTITMPASAFQRLVPTPASARTTLNLRTTAATVTTLSGGLAFFLLMGDLRKRWKTLLGIALAGSAICALLAGCGGLRYLQTDGTPLGTYKVAVTGTSGNISHTQTITVTVR